MPELPLVPLTGSPHRRGRQHGEALSDRIAGNVALYRDRMRHDAGLSDTDISERSTLYLEVFDRLDPDYRAEMDGIAEGSGQSLSDIVMLNARFELLYSAWSTGDADDCTGFGAGIDTTVDGRLLVGQNWDWFPGVSGAMLTWRRDDLTVLAYTEAGIAGAKIGVNSAGIGLCVNGLSSQFDDWKRGGMPYHLRTRRILESRGLAAAIGEAAMDAPSCSANFLIGAAEAGTAGSGVVDVESSPVGSRRLAPDPSEVLVHANHFVDPAVLGIVESWHSSPVTTYHRYRRLSALLNPGRRIGDDDIDSALRDHEGGVLGVCRHPDPEKPAHLRTHTALSVVIDPAAGTVRYTDGPPCESEYTTLRLSDMDALLG